MQKRRFKIPKRRFCLPISETRWKSMDYKTIRNIPKIFDISATAIFKGRNVVKGACKLQNAMFDGGYSDYKKTIATIYIN